MKPPTPTPPTTHTFLHLTHPQLCRCEVCDGSRAGVPAGLGGDEASKSALRGGLWACPSLGRTPGPKLKADVFGVHSLSYYCSIVIYKSVWDMEISHATQDMGWVKAHCETGPSALWEGLICKLMLSLHLASAVYLVFSSFQHVIFSNTGTMSSFANGKNLPERQGVQGWNHFFGVAEHWRRVAHQYYPLLIITWHKIVHFLIINSYIWKRKLVIKMLFF